MELSFEGEIGIVLALVGLAGAGAIMIAPTHTWIGWTLIGLAATGAVALILFHLRGQLPIRTPLVVVGMIVCGAGFLGFSGAYFWSRPSHPPTAVANIPEARASSAPTAPEIAQELAKPREDLRVSFQYQWISETRLRIRYLFRNLGNQTALVTGLGLYEIVSKLPVAEADDTEILCDHIDRMELTIIRTAKMIMGPGAQVGSEDKRRSFYMPVAGEIDGKELKTLDDAITIDSGKAKEMFAEYDISLDHQKGFSRLDLCPIIASTDLNSQSDSVICRGLVAGRDGQSFRRITFSQQCKVLPHTPPPEAHPATTSPPAASPPSPAPPETPTKK